ncbi:MAG: hypothetical protein WCK76_02595, partial [Elusimicrobiota bacterium]
MMERDELTRIMRMIFLAALLSGSGVLLYSADVSTHVLFRTGAKQALDPANDTVNAGYYAATTLHDVDTDLAVGNIKPGVNIFGSTGTCTSDANATAGDILATQTAYVNGYKLTGTISTQTLGGGGARIFLTATGAGTWTVPADWTSSNNTIEVIGGGGSGKVGGGGGGAYSKSVDVSLTPGTDVSFSVGAGAGGA